MMKRNPKDPEGEFERRDYRLSHMVDDVFCADDEFLREKVNKVASDYHPEHWTAPKTITDLTHEVLNQREIIGRATYHRPLLAGDGRDTLQDAIEEAADLLQYLVKLKAERDTE